jgi:hypothetical protein
MMRYLFMVLIFMFCGSAFAAPPVVPSGTTRIQPGLGGSTNYSSSRGYIGRSQSNFGGGQTYFNKSGYSGRTDKSLGGGVRFTGKK